MMSILRINKPPEPFCGQPAHKQRVEGEVKQEDSQNNVFDLSLEELETLQDDLQAVVQMKKNIGYIEKVTPYVTEELKRSNILDFSKKSKLFPHDFYKALKRVEEIIYYKKEIVDHNLFIIRMGLSLLPDRYDVQEDILSRRLPSIDLSYGSSPGLIVDGQRGKFSFVEALYSLEKLYSEKFKSNEVIISDLKSIHGQSLDKDSRVDFSTYETLLNRINEICLRNLEGTWHAINIDEEDKKRREPRYHTYV